MSQKETYRKLCKWTSGDVIECADSDHKQHVTLARPTSLQSRDSGSGPPWPVQFAGFIHHRAIQSLSKDYNEASLKL